MAKALTVSPVLKTKKTIQDLKSVRWKLNPDQAQNTSMISSQRASAQSRKARTSSSGRIAKRATRSGTGGDRFMRRAGRFRRRGGGQGGEAASHLGSGAAAGPLSPVWRRQ